MVMFHWCIRNNVFDTRCLQKKKLSASKDDVMKSSEDAPAFLNVYLMEPHHSSHKPATAFPTVSALGNIS